MFPFKEKCVLKKKKFLSFICTLTGALFLFIRFKHSWGLTTLIKKHKKLCKQFAYSVFFKDNITWIVTSWKEIWNQSVPADLTR